MECSREIPLVRNSQGLVAEEGAREVKGEILQKVILDGAGPARAVRQARQSMLNPCDLPPKASS